MLPKKENKRETERHHAANLAPNKSNAAGAVLVQTHKGEYYTYVRTYNSLTD